jgi:hypothetical protein
VWGKWRAPLVLVVVILLAGTLIALLELDAAPSVSYLDPANTTSTGARAVTDILSARGVQVTRVTTVAAARATAGSAGPGAVTLVVTSPGLLTVGQLDGLARIPADRVLIGPDRPALRALAPEVGLAGVGPVGARPADCALAAARAAGSADMGGGQFSSPLAAKAPRSRRHSAARTAAGQATLCYPSPPPGGAPASTPGRGASSAKSDGLASLVQYTSAGHVITVLGSGNALTNGSLARLGNAALALNLLSGRPRVVWLVAGPQLPASVPPSRQKPLLAVIPLPAYLVALQLGVAVLLAALWRSRRLGPLVPEPLPVVVRASETTEGHAALYQSRRARGRAAAALRTGMLERTLPALGLPPDAGRGGTGGLFPRGQHGAGGMGGSSPRGQHGPTDVVAAFSARSGSGQDRIEAMLFGPAPRDDTALVALADALDALEKEVRTQ